MITLIYIPILHDKIDSRLSEINADGDPYDIDLILQLRPLDYRDANVTDFS